MVSTENTQAPSEEQKARNADSEAKPAASALDVKSDRKVQGAGDEAQAITAVKVMTSSKHQAHQDDSDQDAGGDQDNGDDQSDGADEDTGDITDDNGAIRRDDGSWVVPDAGTFSNRAVYTFDQDTLPDGLTISDYTVQCREEARRDPIRIPYNERFHPKNVQLSNGFLNLTVPGGQEPTKKSNYAISCAEVTTVEQSILYGSIRTNAILSPEPGTCHGMSQIDCRLQSTYSDLDRNVLLPK